MPSTSDVENKEEEKKTVATVIEVIHKGFNVKRKANNLLQSLPEITSYPFQRPSQPTLYQKLRYNQRTRPARPTPSYGLNGPTLTGFEEI